MSEVILYKASDGQIQLKVNLSDDSVWLSLNQLSELFGRDKSVISRHLSNIFKNNELCKYSVVANFATVQKEGAKDVMRDVRYFNLDMIIQLSTHDSL